MKKKTQGILLIVGGIVTIACSIYPTLARAGELAPAGLTIGDNQVAGVIPYITQGDEWITRESGYSDLHQYSSITTTYYSPRGTVASVQKRSNGQTISRVGISNSPWGLIAQPLAYPGSSTVTDDVTTGSCTTFAAEDEVWKIRAHEVSCDDATSALRHYLHVELSPNRWRCIQNEERAKCWRRGDRTRYATATEETSAQIAEARAQRRAQVTYCGDARSIRTGYLVFASKGDSASCQAFAPVAGRIGAHNAIYGSPLQYLDGWTCAYADNGLHCINGPSCVLVGLPDNRFPDYQATRDENGPFVYFRDRMICG